MVFLLFLPLTSITVPSGIRMWSHGLYQGEGYGPKCIGQRLGPWVPLRSPKANWGCPGSHFIMPLSARGDQRAHSGQPSLFTAGDSGHLLSFSLSCLKIGWENTNNKCWLPSLGRHSLLWEIRWRVDGDSVYYLYCFSVDPKLFQNIKYAIFCFCVFF